MDEIESPLLPNLSKGTEVKAKDYSKRTPLHIAVEKEDLEAIRTLISSEPHQVRRKSLSLSIFIPFWSNMYDYLR